MLSFLKTAFFKDDLKSAGNCPFSSTIFNQNETIVY